MATKRKFKGKEVKLKKYLSRLQRRKRKRRFRLQVLYKSKKRLLLSKQRLSFDLE